MGDSLALIDAINAILDERDALRAEVESLRALRERAERIANGMHGNTMEWSAKVEAARFILGDAALVPSPEPDECPNCNDRKCMGCVLREWEHECADDCPFCCAPSVEGSETPPVRPPLMHDLGDTSVRWSGKNRLVERARSVEKENKTP